MDPLAVKPRGRLVDINVRLNVQAFFRTFIPLIIAARRFSEEASVDWSSSTCLAVSRIVSRGTVMPCFSRARDKASALTRPKGGIVSGGSIGVDVNNNSSADKAVDCHACQTNLGHWRDI